MTEPWKFRPRKCSLNFCTVSDGTKTGMHTSQKPKPLDSSADSTWQLPNVLRRIRWASKNWLSFHDSLKAGVRRGSKQDRQCKLALDTRKGGYWENPLAIKSVSCLLSVFNGQEHICQGSVLLN